MTSHTNLDAANCPFNNLIMTLLPPTPPALIPGCSRWRVLGRYRVGSREAVSHCVRSIIADRLWRSHATLVSHSSPNFHHLNTSLFHVTHWCLHVLSRNLLYIHLYTLCALYTIKLSFQILPVGLMFYLIVAYIIVTVAYVFVTRLNVTRLYIIYILIYLWLAYLLTFATDIQNRTLFTERWDVIR